MIQVIWPRSASLDHRFRGLNEAAKLNAPLAERCRADLRRLVIEDHADKMLRGVNGDGTPRAPLAPSTLADPRRGPGPSLIPHGASSRFVTHFETFWEWEDGGPGDYGAHATLSMRFVDILSTQGESFAQYHLTGCPPGSNPARPNWSLPRRDVARITPKYWSRLVARCRQFGADLVRAAASAARR